jgi:putative intracellular protease/amidase/carbonic anhydrase
VQVAYLLYDRFTALDITGPHDVLNSVPGNESIFVAEETGPVRNESDTLSLVADASIEEVTSPDIVVVPGGFGNRALLEHEPLHEWLRTVHETSTWTTSVCTGSLLLAAAGLLDGAPATTHWLARDLLAELGARPVAERVVEHGKIVTAAGVSAGIDMALGLVQRINGDEVAQAVQLGIEYDPDPPLDAGSPEKAPQPIVELVTAAFAAQDKRAAELTVPELPSLPRRGLVVLTCLDHRIDPIAALGLELGDAAIIRNAGGRVTPSFLQNLALLGLVARSRGGDPSTFELILMQHTKCGVGGLGEEHEDALASYFGVPADLLAAKSPSDPYKGIRVDIEALAANPAAPASLTVEGRVYDVDSGRTELVERREPLRAP